MPDTIAKVSNTNRESTVSNAPSSRGLGAWTYKLGGACYALWGLWHLRVVYNLWTYAGAQSGALVPRLEQGAFHILGFALCAIGVGLLMNWKNSRTGYWVNLLAIGWTEIGLFAIIFPALPAIPLLIWVGPVLWILAVAGATAGYLTQPQTP